MIRLIMKMTGVKRIPAKKWSIPTGNRYPGLLGKSHNGAQIARKTRVVMENRANENFLHFPCHLRITPYNAPPLTRNNGKQAAGSAGSSENLAEKSKINA